MSFEKKTANKVNINTAKKQITYKKGAATKAAPFYSSSVFK